MQEYARTLNLKRLPALSSIHRISTEEVTKDIAQGLLEHAEAQTYVGLLDSRRTEDADICASFFHLCSRRKRLQSGNCKHIAHSRRHHVPWSFMQAA
jgi:hypothetical protein